LVLILRLLKNANGLDIEGCALMESLLTVSFLQ